MARWGIEARMEVLRSARLRQLPSANAALSCAAALELLERFGRLAATDAIRVELDQARSALESGATSVPTEQDIALLEDTHAKSPMSIA